MRGDRLITSEEQSKIVGNMYDEMFPVMLSYARRQLNSPELAEEAVQETFRIACEKPGELLKCSTPKGWLMESLKRVISNMRRGIATARMVEINLSDDMPEPGKSDDYFDIEYSDQKNFNLIHLIAKGKMSMVDAAKELKITPEDARKRMQRYREDFFGKNKK